MTSTIKIVTPQKDKQRPYTQRQLLDAVRAILCNGKCVVLPNAQGQGQKKAG